MAKISFGSRKKEQKERKLQHAIVDFFSLKGIFCWVDFQPNVPRGTVGHYGRHWTSKGVSDIIGSHNFGKGYEEPFVMECKIGKNKLTEFQENFQKRARLHGWRTFKATSLEEAAAHLGLKL